MENRFMKKAYTLLLTILLLTIFSFLSIQILQTKAIKSENIKNQFLYIQAKNHLIFLEEYVKSIDLKNIESIKIEDNLFDIKAIKSKDLKHINLYVKSFDYNVRVTKIINIE